MANPLANFMTFIAGVREEIKQVTWPTWDDLVGSLLVVFVGVALLATFISICDFILSRVAQVVLR